MLRYEFLPFVLLALNPSPSPKKTHKTQFRNVSVLKEAQKAGSTSLKQPGRVRAKEPTSGITEWAGQGEEGCHWAAPGQRGMSVGGARARKDVSGQGQGEEGHQWVGSGQGEMSMGEDRAK